MKKHSKFPDTIPLLFFIMIVVLISTWIIPSGQFERIEVDGRTIVASGSYKEIVSNPQNIFSLFTAIPKGLAEAQEIIFFVFIVGGAFRIVTESGIINAWLQVMVKKFKGKEYYAIAATILVIGMAGTTTGFKEETLMIVPFGIAMAEAMGFDSMTGVAMISLGAAFGFYTGVINPFSVGIAQEISELPIFSGIGLRVVMFVVYRFITVFYVVRYAKKVKNSNKNIKDKLAISVNNEGKIIDNRKLWSITLVVCLTFIFILYGVFRLNWFIVEIGGCFLIMALLCGILDGKSLNEITKALIEGMKDLLEPAMVIGWARAILVIMENGYILDTIVNYLTSLVTGFPGPLATLGFYVIQILVNFIIPASTGQAATTMPIMTPLADAIGITRQTSVLAYMLGSGFMDSIIPTAGVLMAQLSIGKIDYKDWVKFVYPLIIIWILVGAGFLLFAYYINYGPF